MGYLIAIILLFAAGGVYVAEQKGEELGRASVEAQLKAANDSIDAMAKGWEDEYDHHITDMAAAWDAGESSAQQRVVYVQSKGAQDVAKNAKLSDLSCAIGPDLVRNVNAALLGMRREPPADGVRNDPAVGQGAAAGPPANPAGAAQGVRGGDAATGRPPGGPVPEAAGDRRPLGKVHPKG